LRLHEVIDGLETLRILRMLTQKNKSCMTREKFLEQASMMWGTSLDEKCTLLEVRRREKLEGTSIFLNA